jgi:citrate lyase subunit beta/citryl-CoA lyase
VSSAEQRLHRSYLYAPATDERLMRKALTAGADAVILDLEDSVPQDQKANARKAVSALLEELRNSSAGDPPELSQDLHVRVNRDGDGYDLDDLECAVDSGVAAIRLPKAESVEGLRAACAELDRLELARQLPVGTTRIYPTVESARGAVMIGELLAVSDRVARAALGTTDLLADIGAYGDDDLATLHVRSHLVLMSRVASVGPPIDSVHTALEDDTGLHAAATRARALGFFGKSVIHPRQLAGVHDVFTPTARQLSHAEAVLEAYETAMRHGRGAVNADGAFIDEAVVARARSLLSLRNRR